MDLYVEIKELRKAKRYNMVELSKESGVAYNTVRLFEKGQKDITLKKLNKILNVLNAELKLKVKWTYKR